MLCVAWHALPKHPLGLIVPGDLIQNYGHAERRVALEMIHRHSAGSIRQLTIGPGFVTTLRKVCGTRHVAKTSLNSAIARTTRHTGCALQIRHRKRMKDAFGWAKAANMT